MHWELIRQAPLAVQMHLFTVLPAFFLGTWLMFFSRKGSPWHRGVGFAYLTLMATTATIAIFVRVAHPGRFSLLHLFIPLTYWGVSSAIWRVRKGDVKGHMEAMRGLYFGALVFAGALAIVPADRLMHRLLFG